jgi:hypothetical protein
LTGSAQAVEHVVHHRNNMVFSNGKASIKNSISFLQNYLVTLQNIAKGKARLIEKVKQSCSKKQK